MTKTTGRTSTIVGVLIGVVFRGDQFKIYELIAIIFFALVINQFPQLLKEKQYDK